MTELDLNQDSLDSKDIQSIEGTEQTPPVAEDTQTPEVPEGTITVEELLNQQMDKESQEEIRKRDEEMLKEINEQMGIQKEENKETPEVPEQEKDETQAEGDEPAQFQEILQKLKQHQDQKISDAEKAVWKAQTEAEAEKKVFQAEKKILEDKIKELSESLIETQHSSISAEDNAVVRHNYLRTQFKNDKENPKRGNDLGNFHLRYASTYYGIDESDLMAAVASIKSGRASAKEAVSKGYQTGGGVSKQQYKPTSTKTQSKKRLNPKLLSR